MAVFDDICVQEWQEEYFVYGKGQTCENKGEGPFH